MLKKSGALAVVLFTGLLINDAAKAFESHWSLSLQQDNINSRALSADSKNASRIGIPLGRTVEQLPDGVYGLCDRSEINDHSRGTQCFSFKKSGNYVVGLHWPDRSDFDDLCIEGRVKGNTVTGFGVYYHGSEWARGQDWSGRGLRVRNMRVIQRAETPDQSNEIVRFDSLLLNLAGFHYYPDMISDASVPQGCR